MVRVKNRLSLCKTSWVVQYCVCVKKFLSSLDICWVRFKTIRCGLPCHIIISQKFTGIFAMSNIFLKIISIKTDTLSYKSNLSLSLLKKSFVDLKVQNYSLLKSMGDVKMSSFLQFGFWMCVFFAFGLLWAHHPFLARGRFNCWVGENTCFRNFTVTAFFGSAKWKWK